MARKTKEEPIPADLLAMSLEQLQVEQDADSQDEEFAALVETRDKAQAAIEKFVQRKRDRIRAIIKKQEELLRGRD